MNKIHFFNGNIVFGYDGYLMSDDKITSIISTSLTKPALSIGMEIDVFGDVRGYIPGGVKPGVARIAEFRLPFTDLASDEIIQVKDSYGNIGWVKPTNVRFL